MRPTLAVAGFVAFASLIQTDAGLQGARAETDPLRSITLKASDGKASADIVGVGRWWPIVKAAAITSE